MPISAKMALVKAKNYQAKIPLPMIPEGLKGQIFLPVWIGN